MLRAHFDSVSSDFHKSCMFFVYAGAARYPFMKSVTPLPDNIAAWFTYHETSWSPEVPSSESFAFAMARCLESGEPAALEEFLHLLAANGTYPGSSPITLVFHTLYQVPM